MARTPKSMRHILEVLRLKYQHQLTVREIARSSGLPVSTVGDYVQRFQAAGLTWPLPEGFGGSGAAARRGAVVRRHHLQSKSS